MRYCFIFFLLFTSVTAAAQTTHLSKFYPEHISYKKLKVKAVIDSFMIVPANSRIKEYDESGRELCDHYLIGGCTPFRYIRNGDTLTRLKYYDKPGENYLFSFEQFIYNSRGDILKHSLSYNSYTGEKKVYAELNEFIYNSTGLYCHLTYYNHDYKKPVMADMVINGDELKLSEATYYTYKKNNSGLVIIAKQTVGNPAWRTTDTIFYDKANRLIKQSTFSRRGNSGELVFDNFNYVHENQYKGSIVIQKEFYTYCLALTNEGACLSPQLVDIGKEELIYDSNGLLLSESSFYPNGEKHLVSKYSYLFYK